MAGGRSSTNNDPGVETRYYVGCIKQLEGAARVVRADCGTENVYLAAIQHFFRSQRHSELFKVLNPPVGTLFF